MPNLLDVEDKTERTMMLLEAVLDGAIPRGIAVVKMLAEQKKLVPVMTTSDFAASFAFGEVIPLLVGTKQVGRNKLGDMVKQESPLCVLPDFIQDLVRPNLTTAAQPSGLVHGREERPTQTEVDVKGGEIAKDNS